MKEEWRPVKGFKGFYEISNKGLVRSLDREVVTEKGHRRICKGRILKRNGPSGCHNLTDGVINNTRTAALIFMEAFGPSKPKKDPVVMAKDGNIKNVSLQNLYWTTRGQISKEIIWREENRERLRNLHKQVYKRCPRERDEFGRFKRA